jgi:hypothetical protein
VRERERERERARESASSPPRPAQRAPFLAAAERRLLPHRSEHARVYFTRKCKAAIEEQQQRANGASGGDGASGGGGGGSKKSASDEWAMLRELERQLEAVVDEKDAALRAQGGALHIHANTSTVAGRRQVI